MVDHYDLNYFDYDNYNRQIEEKNFCLDCKLKIEKCSFCEGIFEKTFFNHYHKIKCEKIMERQKRLIWEGENYIEEDNDIIIFENDEIKKMCKICNRTFSDVLYGEHKVKCAIIFEEKSLMTLKTPCNSCGEKISKALIEEHEEKCKILKRREEILKKSSLKFKYPEEWNKEFIEKDEGLEPSLYILSKNSKEWNFCEKKFKESVKDINITNIYRIQHKYLYEKYYLEKQRLIKEKGKTEEKWLFHGSRNTEPKKIYMKGFDICFANQGSYGYGNYFARQAIYSYQNYAYHFKEKRYIFLCKVLTGLPFVSHSKVFTKPPLLDEKMNIFYDSVTDVDPVKAEKDSKPQMYIVYENDKAYPFYIIEYSQSNSISSNSNEKQEGPIAFVRNLK